MLPEIITTTRLRLRPFQLRDAADVFAYATDQEWARYLPTPDPYTFADAERFVAGQVLLDHRVEPHWAIEHTEVVIGGITLRLFHEQRIGELGYSLARSAWGQGFTTEAAQAVIDTAFTTCSALQRIRAMALAPNVASLRVMDKLGMQREGTLRQNYLLRNQLFDAVWCGLLRSEWEADYPPRTPRYGR
jgi:ribosomal-protein-alanine N-acetyltransferase